MPRSRWLIALGVALVGASSARGQSARTVSLSVAVVDSSGAAIPGADVSVVRGLSTIIVHGVSDASGALSVSFAATGRDAELVVRKLGYIRANRFFVDSLVPARVTVTLARSAHALDTVRVAEREDPTRHSYFIDAESIENSSRVVVDALDVVMKLRPDMIWGRSGGPDHIGRAPDIFKRPSTNRGTRFTAILGDCGGPQGSMRRVVPALPWPPNRRTCTTALSRISGSMAHGFETYRSIPQRGSNVRDSAWTSRR